MTWSCLVTAIIARFPSHSASHTVQKEVQFGRQRPSSNGSARRGGHVQHGYDQRTILDDDLSASSHLGRQRGEVARHLGCRDMDRCHMHDHTACSFRVLVRSCSLGSVPSGHEFPLLSAFGGRKAPSSMGKISIAEVPSATLRTGSSTPRHKRCAARSIGEALRSG